jgi:uncharacterized surface protein with fasciclin (FAS1) repeats
MIRTMMIATMAVTMMSGAALAGSCGGSSHSHDVKTSAVESTPDIVDTAIAAGDFKTLVTAVEAAELVEVLKGEGPFTVFAPTDEAFAALPKGTVEGLLADKPELRGVLTYHVVSGKILAGDLAAKGAGTLNVETVNGQSLTVIVAKDGAVTVDGAKVVATDIMAGNGVIHVIDAVVLPKSAS